MRKLFAAFLLVGAGMGACVNSEACCYRGYGYRQWVGPALIGGVIGYELARPPVIVQQPILIQQPQVVYTQPVPPAGYHYQIMINPQNNYQQWVLVPN